MVSGRRVAQVGFLLCSCKHFIPSRSTWSKGNSRPWQLALGRTFPRARLPPTTLLQDQHPSWLTPDPRRYFFFPERPTVHGWGKPTHCPLGALRNNMAQVNVKTSQWHCPSSYSVSGLETIHKSQPQRWYRFLQNDDEWYLLYLPREGTFTLILTSLALAWSLLEYGLVTVGSNIQLTGGIYFARTGQRVERVTHYITGRLQ